MFKYFITGIICLLVGAQLYPFANVLQVTSIPAALLIIFGMLLIIGSFFSSAKQAAESLENEKH